MAYMSIYVCLTRPDGPSLSRALDRSGPSSFSVTLTSWRIGKGIPN